MLRLAIIALISLSALRSNKKPEFRILILDECVEWKFKSSYTDSESLEHQKIAESVIHLEKNFDSSNYVWITHLGLLEENPMLTIELTLPEVLSRNPSFSSEFSMKEWHEFRIKKPIQPVYVLIPSDYCSEKRFLANQKFTLYLVHLELPYTE